MSSIPNEISAKFNTISGRADLVCMYGYNSMPFQGMNEDGEIVWVSINHASGIVCKTYQGNGWIRVNEYDVDGYAVGETFEGRWKPPPCAETAARDLFIDDAYIGKVKMYFQYKIKSRRVGWCFVLETDAPYTVEIKIQFDKIKLFTSSGKLNIITNGN